MSVEATEFDRLMEGVRAGSEEAARQLYEVYGRHILRVVRRKLHARMRSQYDSADFLQSVMASFFAVPAERNFASPAELVEFLSAVATNKVIDAFRRRLQTDKHNLNRELFLDDVGPDAAQAKTPTPSQVLMGDEYRERLERIKSPLLREVVDMRLAGLSFEEIVERTGLHMKAIKHCLSQLDERGRE